MRLPVLETVIELFPGDFDPGSVVKIRRSVQNSVISQDSSTAARIHWYEKHCTKTKRFCHQLRLARNRAAAIYRREMKERDHKLKIEQKIVKNIERRNPHIGRHLANNMKDYILSRMNEEFY